MTNQQTFADEIDTYGFTKEIDNGSNMFTTTLYAYNNKFPVVNIENARYTDVINQLDVSYTALQSLNSSQLKVELTKLYDRLPEASISIKLFDAEGRLTTELDNREKELNYFYDIHGRLDYISDKDGNIIKKNEYNIGN